MFYDPYDHVKRILAFMVTLKLYQVGSKTKGFRRRKLLKHEDNSIEEVF